MARQIASVNPNYVVPLEPDGSDKPTSTLSLYASPDGRKPQVVSNMAILFSDDFGGSSVDTTVRWDVIDGGLGANPTLHGQTLTQGAIGSGTTGITDSVSSSQLVVAMNTTNGAERWYLSQQAFAGTEDIMAVVTFSQRLAANSVRIGLIEVDPVTLIPLLNPNQAGEGTNWGGAELGASTVNGAYNAEAIGDSSSTKATGTAGTGTTFLSGDEIFWEFHAEDLIVSTSAIDTIGARNTTPARVAKQTPNDSKIYKLLMRFHNLSTPGNNTNVFIDRILVVDSQEMRVDVVGARGDSAALKALPVILNAGQSVGAYVGAVGFIPQISIGPSTFHKLTAAATTNATSVKASPCMASGGSLRNRAASERYFKFYNKNSAPTVGTDVPILTIGLEAGADKNLGEFWGTYGMRFTAGMAYAITGAYADADTTAVSAADVDVNLIYT